jgi:hypothetical protein
MSLSEIGFRFSGKFKVTVRIAPSRVCSNILNFL